MDVMHLSHGRKSKGRSESESADPECKRARFTGERRRKKAKRKHETDVVSSEIDLLPKKRKGDFRVSDSAERKKKPKRDASTECYSGCGDAKPYRPTKSNTNEVKKRGRGAGDDADEAKFIEELRSGVTSILRGLEPDETSTRPPRVTETCPPRHSDSGDVESEKRKKKRKKKKRKPLEREDTATQKSASSKTSEDFIKASSSSSKRELKRKKGKATAKVGEESNVILSAEEETRKSFSNFTLQERSAQSSSKLSSPNIPDGTHEESSPKQETLAKQPIADCLVKKTTNQRRRPLTLASSADVRERALARIRAAQFRMLNEELYTTASDEAVQSFESDPKSFQVYHEGFEQQVAKWPVNPVDVLIDALRSMPKSTVIADLGCGEAKIARELTKNKVHSFDLIALNEHVTVCDMSKVPLPNQSVDVAVFCLSLMGTNLNMFVLEANRILKKGGILKIAEVKSRFPSTQGFAKTMKKFGFELEHVDESNKMFVLFDFKKVRSTTQHPHLPTLKLMPCLYKKR
uniref:Ribosomal RNA-processing protein 8 n=1 Tax=Amblyomma aureolatum TaxID=187763 RepID=A0A1E1XH29_9ACAR